MRSTKRYDQRARTCERNKCERHHACTLQHEDCRGFVRWDIAWSFGFTIMQRTCRCTEQDACSDENTNDHRERVGCIHGREPFLKIVGLSILKRGTIEQVVVSMVPFVCATIGCPVLAATVRWELSLYVVLDALGAVSEAAGFDIAVHFGVHRQASLA